MKQSLILQVFSSSFFFTIHHPPLQGSGFWGAAL
jgi:hypothetical protein